MNKKPIVILGGGGHASVLVEILKTQRRKIKAIVCPDNIASRPVFNNIQQLYADEDILQFSSDDIELVNAIGTRPRSTLRYCINEKFLAWGYHFATVISDSAYVSDHAYIGDGVQILTYAVIHPGTVIGNHTVINTRAVIEHDCTIGAYNFIAPGAVLCGQVRTKDNVFIGAGATIIPNIDIEEKGIVTAGAILVTTLRTGKACYPGKALIK